MLIVCPSCATAYEVEPAILRPSGRQVRCVRCRTVWPAESQAEELLAAAAALAAQRGLPEISVGDTAEIEATAAATAGAPTLSESIDPLPDAPADANQAPAVPAGADLVDTGSSNGGAVVEVEAPSIAPVGLGDTKPPVVIDADSGDVAPPDGHPEDIETVAARRFQRGPKRRGPVWALSKLQMAILALVIVDAILVGWRTDIVRILPQTASLYAAMGLPVNLRGLSFDAVTTSMESHEGVPILVLQGKIVNDTSAVIDVPRLKLIVRNAAKQDIYSWTAVPPLGRLSAYQAVTFHARLASPPAQSHDVLVRFLNHRDFVAEGQ